MYHCGENVWADELIQVAASVLFKRDLLVFTKDRIFKYKLFENDLMPLLIAFEKNHFVPLLSYSFKSSDSFITLDLLSDTRKRKECEVLQYGNPCNLIIFTIAARRNYSGF